MFIAGQILEGNFLSPKLVGDRVGLHPVWIMFALLAGGAVFGFVGVLVAVPTAAMIGVLVRHLMGRYRESEIYRGEQAGLKASRDVEPADVRSRAARTHLRAARFHHRRRQSRGAGLARPLARLAGTGAGAERSARQRQDPSRPHLGEARRRVALLDGADLDGKSVADLADTGGGLAHHRRSSTPTSARNGTCSISTI